MAMFKWIVAKLIEDHADDVVKRILDWLRGKTDTVGPFGASGFSCPPPSDDEKTEAIDFCEKALEAVGN